MGENSKIEWTDTTWNPLAGCTPISPGCTHCYAATMARRLEAMGQQKYAGTAERRGNVDVFTGRINLGDEKSLKEPLKWKKPRMVFVNSMSDLFHEAVPDWFIDRVFSVMLAARKHTFQVLTKRPERAAKWFNDLQAAADSWVPQTKDGKFTCRDVLNVRWMHAHGHVGSPLPDVEWPAPNIWIGTSCEDQKRADERIPHLLKCPARVRFLSCEPLLGPVDIDKYLWPFDESGRPKFTFSNTPEPHGSRYPLGLIHWVIVGGESGPRARPMHPDWARSLRDQCLAAGVSYFFKQFGEWAPGDHKTSTHWGSKGFVQPTPEASYDYGTPNEPKGPLQLIDDGFAYMEKVGKHVAGRLLDGREWSEFPVGSN